MYEALNRARRHWLWRLGHHKTVRDLLIMKRISVFNKATNETVQVEDTGER